jgi:hypothetical protein
MAVPSEAQASVDYLRRYGAASSTDIFDGVTYWDDNQLYEVVLEATSYKKVYLTPVDKGGFVYIDRLPKHYYLKVSSIELEGTSLTPTYDANTRTYTFASKPSYAPLLYASYWNMYDALALLWEQKANQRFELIRIKGGANQMFMEQEYEHCIQQMKYYRSKTIRRF